MVKVLISLVIEAMLLLICIRAFAISLIVALPVVLEFVFSVNTAM